MKPVATTFVVSQSLPWRHLFLACLFLASGAVHGEPDETPIEKLLSSGPFVIDVAPLVTRLPNYSEASSYPMGLPVIVAIDSQLNKIAAAGAKTVRIGEAQSTEVFVGDLNPGRISYLVTVPGVVTALAIDPSGQKIAVGTVGTPEHIRSENSASSWNRGWGGSGTVESVVNEYRSKTKLQIIDLAAQKDPIAIENSPELFQLRDSTTFASGFAPKHDRSYAWKGGLSPGKRSILFSECGRYVSVSGSGGISVHDLEKIPDSYLRTFPLNKAKDLQPTFKFFGKPSVLIGVDSTNRITVQ